MLEAVSHNVSVLVLRLKYRWRYGAPRGQTMTILCQLVRTKNFLIMSTSLMFLMCTVYLASHPGWVGEYQLVDTGGGGVNPRVQVSQVAVKHFEVPDAYLQLLGLTVNVSAAAAAAAAPAAAAPAADSAVVVAADGPAGIDADAEDDFSDQTPPPPAVPPVLRWSVLIDVEQRRLNSTLLSSLDLVLVSAASTSGVDKTLRLISSIKQHVPQLYLLLFDLGLDKEAKEKLDIYCNLTAVCELLPFQSDPFPAYVRELEVGAYKALIMQACLVHFPTVWWVDPEEYFVSNATEPVLRVVDRLGVAAWQAASLDSTSALSHPNMFAYFGYTADDFYFHRMLQPSHYVFSSSRARQASAAAGYVQQQQQRRRSTDSGGAYAVAAASAPTAATASEKAMLLWLQCALTQGCVSPPGATSGGGCKEKRPKYKYTGCHEFEASALSVALGRSFGFVQDYLLSYSSFVVAGGGTATMQQQQRGGSSGGSSVVDDSFVPLFGTDDGNRFNISAVRLIIERERARIEAEAKAAEAAAAMAAASRPLAVVGSTVSRPMFDYAAAGRSAPDYAVGVQPPPLRTNSWGSRRAQQQQQLAADGDHALPAVRRRPDSEEPPGEVGADGLDGLHEGADEGT